MNLFHIKNYLAARTSCEALQLELYKDGRLRHNLASNINLSRNMQLQLASTYNEYINFYLSINTGILKEIQLILFRLLNPYFKKHLIENPGLDKEIQVTIANKYSLSDAYLLSKNANLCDEARDILKERQIYNEF